MFVQVVLVLLFSLVNGQGSSLQINAGAAIPSGPTASAIASGFGANVQGIADALVDEGASAASSIITAVGAAPQNPSYPQQNPPQITPKPQSQIIYQPTPTPAKKYFIDAKPSCEDIKDDKCYKIDDYYTCGFCAIEKYPIKGYACKYVQDKIIKKDSKKSGGYEYQTVITPLCDCDGVFVLKGEYCPTCKKLLADLFKCAGVIDPRKADVIEIPEKCLKEVAITEKELVKCGYVADPYDKQVIVKKEKEPKQYVIVVDKNQNKPAQDGVIYVYNQKTEMPSAFSSAQATATGDGATAFATADAFVSHNGL